MITNKVALVKVAFVLALCSQGARWADQDFAHHASHSLTVRLIAALVLFFFVGYGGRQIMDLGAWAAGKISIFQRGFRLTVFTFSIILGLFFVLAGWSFLCRHPLLGESLLQLLDAWSLFLAILPRLLLYLVIGLAFVTVLSFIGRFLREFFFASYRRDLDELTRQIEELRSALNLGKESTES